MLPFVPALSVARKLPMDPDSRLARAKELGFDTDFMLYHGGSSEFPAFEKSRRGGPYLSDSPDIGGIYAENAQRRWPGQNNAGPNIVPVYVRGKRLVVSDQGPGGGGWLSDNLAAKLGVDLESVPVAKRPKFLDEEARKQGYTVIEIRDIDDLGGPQTQYRVIDQTAVRSINAEFDPQKKDLTGLLD